MYLPLLKRGYPGDSLNCNINPYLATHYFKYLLTILTITIRNASYNTLAGYKMAGCQSSPMSNFDNLSFWTGLLCAPVSCTYDFPLPCHLKKYPLIKGTRYENDYLSLKLTALYVSPVQNGCLSKLDH